MLNDREYMRQPPRNTVEDARSGFHALIALIIVNVILWLFQLQKDETLLLSPEDFRSGYYWQVFTAMFLHYDFWHLFFNMFSLYVLGSLSAPVIGAKRFLILYIVSGLAGNLLWLGASWNIPHVAILGASGAVAGITIASAMIVPDIQMMLLLIPFPIKLRTMAIILFVLNIMSHIGGIGGNVAYLAHIGGFIGGMLLMRFAFSRYVQWDPLSFLGRLPNDRRYGSRPASPPRGWTVRDDTYAPPPTGRVSQKELDALLDKLSRGGVNSLSEAELERLRQAREQMRTDNK